MGMIMIMIINNNNNNDKMEKKSNPPNHSTDRGESASPPVFTYDHHNDPNNHVEHSFSPYNRSQSSSHTSLHKPSSQPSLYKPSSNPSRSHSSINRVISNTSLGSSPFQQIPYSSPVHKPVIDSPPDQVNNHSPPYQASLSSPFNKPVIYSPPHQYPFVSYIPLHPPQPFSLQTPVQNNSNELNNAAHNISPPHASFNFNSNQNLKN